MWLIKFLIWLLKWYLPKLINNCISYTDKKITQSILRKCLFHPQILGLNKKMGNSSQSTRKGRVLWEELLILSRFHPLLRANERYFCPLTDWLPTCHYRAGSGTILNLYSIRQSTSFWDLVSLPSSLLPWIVLTKATMNIKLQVGNYVDVQFGLYYITRVQAGPWQ